MRRQLGVSRSLLSPLALETQATQPLHTAALFVYITIKLTVDSFPCAIRSAVNLIAVLM